MTGMVTQGTVIMKIKEVSVEARRSYDYNSFSVGLTATIDDNDNYEDVVLKLQDASNRLAVEKIKKVFKKKDEN